MNYVYDQDKTDEPVEEPEAPSRVGELVKVSHLDTATLVDVVRFGTVIEDRPEGVVVGLFPEVIGPLPLDSECHERVDAPRVEFLADVDEVVDALTKG